MLQIVMAGKYRLSKDMDIESIFVETVCEMKSFTALQYNKVTRCYYIFAHLITLMQSNKKTIAFLLMCLLHLNVISSYRCHIVVISAGYLVIISNLSLHAMLTNVNILHFSITFLQ